MEPSLQPVITAIQLYCGTFIQWLIGVAPTGGHSDWSGGEKWLQRWNTLPCTAEAEGHSSTIYTLSLRPEQEEPSLRRKMMFRLYQVPYRPASAFPLGCCPLKSSQPIICRNRSWVIRVSFANINWLRHLFIAPMNLLPAPPPDLPSVFCRLGSLPSKSQSWLLSLHHSL